MNIIKEIIQNHKFFVDSSNDFMRHMKGRNRWKYVLRYPIAYIRFQYYAIKAII